jgi:ubiquinone/menaquinone biosynthesis C-methylase UbiE
MSKHVRENNLDKKYMLKELSRVAKKEGHTDTSYILLIDDSPEKNLLNSRYNAIHPRTWLGDIADDFLSSALKPWLQLLFLSRLKVSEFVKAKPLLGYQCPMNPRSALVDSII